FSPDNGDVLNTDPQLGPLQDNNGPTKTMALGSTAPAVNAVPPGAQYTDAFGVTQNDCATTDQRGLARPGDADQNNCDVGAFEYASSDSNVISLTCPTYSDLAGAIADVPDGGKVVLACSTADDINFSINASSAGGGTITIGKNITLDGSRSTAAISFDGNTDTQLFTVGNG